MCSFLPPALDYSRPWDQIMAAGQKCGVICWIMNHGLANSSEYSRHRAHQTSVTIVVNLLKLISALFSTFTPLWVSDLTHNTNVRAHPLILNCANLEKADKQNYNNNEPDWLWRPSASSSDHHDITERGRVGARGEICKMSWILDYIWLWNILRHGTTVPGWRRALWHAVTCQMPTNITFSDNFCFLLKVLKNTSQESGHWPGYLEYKPPNTLQLGDYRNRHWLCRFTFFNPLFGIP